MLWIKLLLIEVVMVSMTYGAGMPLLYPIGLSTFGVSYAVDKFLFLRWYRIPPEFGPDLTLFASYTMLFAPPIHLGFAIWMYSTPGIFVPSELAFFDRISQSFPSLVLLIICVGVLVLDSTIVSFVKVIWGLLKRSKMLTRLPSVVEDEEFTSVTEAKASGLFGGSLLRTYNMLENKKYMRAFGIDAEFAKNHRDIVELIQHNQVDDTVPQLPENFQALGTDVPNS